MSVPILWMVISLLAVAGLQSAVPQLTRTDLFFAVTVPAEFRRSPAGRQTLWHYRLIVWGSTLIALVIILAAGEPWVALLILCAGYLLAFVSARQKVLAHAAAPDPVVEVDLEAPPERLQGGPVILLLPVVALGVLGFWAVRHLDRLPVNLAVHWGFNGPNRWVSTTAGSVLGLVGVHAALALVLAGFAWSLLYGSRRISTSGAAGLAERRFRRNLMWMVILMEYLTACPAAFTLLLPGELAMRAWVVALTVLIVAFAVILFRSGQGGSRAVAFASGRPRGDRTPDSRWKWGLIYVNRDDPSILVEKRFGVGYTINLGNRWTWAAIAVLLVPAAVAMIWLR